MSIYEINPTVQVIEDGHSIIVRELAGQGPQGIQGPEGPIGEKGDQGDPGTPGLDGSQGIPGEQGPIGNDGDVGPTGKSVLDGIAAPSSPLGQEGDFYLNTQTHEIFGPKMGNDWGAGTSIIGPQGPIGNSGADSLVPGPTGNDGIDGTNGADGASGAGGSSAYDTWLAQSNTGSEADFVASLKGDKGENGDQGEPGPAGNDGIIPGHGSISGLGADDHTQYHNDARGDARYHKKSEHVTMSTGASDAGKPVTLDAAGKLDLSILSVSGGGAWGSITGTLSNQTDLQAILSGKSDSAHGHTASEISLGNVDNTSDLNKPISTATQSALDNTIDDAPSDGGEYVRKNSAWSAIDNYHTDTVADTWLGTKNSDSLAEGSVNLYLTATDKSKISGIEVAATADQTGAEITALIDAELGSIDWQTGAGSGVIEDPVVYNNGNVSGSVVVDYSNGKVQEMMLTGAVTSLSVSNWPATGIRAALTLYIDTSSLQTSDFSFVTSWATGSAPTLAIGSNELVFTTKDGGTKVIGHSIALGA